MLKAYGLNTALLKHGNYSVNESLLQGWAGIAAKVGIRFLPVINFAGNHEITLLQGAFIPYVDRYGNVLAATPCPLDAHYWEAIITRRFQQLAQLSQSSGIVGALFDTEMYGSDLSMYTDLCFCDACWQKFLEAERQNIPPQKKEQRFNYLMENHLFELYERTQIHTLQDILSKIRRSVHILNPKFVLGFVAFTDSWFYQGLIRGLGTQSMPVRVFSERTYIRGFTPDVLAEKSLITGISPQTEQRNANLAMKPIAEYIPGLWLGRFFPARLSSELYALATHTSGYWIFTADSLWSENPTQEPYVLHGRNDDHWEAIRIANTELLRHSNNPESYHSHIRAVYQSSFYEKSQQRLIRPESLAHFMQNVVTKHFSSLTNKKPQTTRALNYQNDMLFHCTKAQNVEGEIRINVISNQEKEERIFYMIFDNRGEIIREGSVSTQDASEKILIPPEYSGLLSLMVQAGPNSTQIEISGMPYIVEASSTFHLSTSNTPYTYTFFVKSDMRRVQLRAYYYNENPAHLVVISESDQIIQQAAVKGLSEIQLMTAWQENYHFDRMSAQTLSIQALPSTQIGDISFYFFNEEFPYVIVKK